MLIVLLKVDLSKEDVPGGEGFIGQLLLLSNTALPGGALTLAILSFGFDAGTAAKDAQKEKEEEEEKNKQQQKKKSGKKQSKKGTDEVEFEDNPMADDAE
jgi:hypothetical protein